MKKTIIMSTLAALLPLTSIAQDDLYFVPSKKNVEKVKREYGIPKDTYYSGSNRSVDEYNRRGHTECWEKESVGQSEIIAIDSLGNPIDTLQLGQKSTKRFLDTDDDYECTRRMAMWDGYQVSNAYWHGYNDGRFGRWYGWSSYWDPWYYSSWYSPYSFWYDPWYTGYYGWYSGYYHPFYDYWGWGWGWPYDHYHYIGGVAHSHGGYYGTGRTGTANHGGGGSGRGVRPQSAFGSGRSISSGIANRDRSSNINNRLGSNNRFSSRSRTSDANGFNNRYAGSSRSGNNNASYSNNSSSRSSSVSSGGSSFSSGRSGGFSGGGSRSGGGFGGGGSRSGGGRR